MLLLTAATAILASCNPFAPDGKDFVIRVDSVKAPGAVSGGGPFTLKFYGPVGGSGCFHFKEFRVTRAAGSADVTVIGHHDEHALCTQAVVFLEGEPLTISPPVTDPFLLTVHQPDNTVLTRTVRAE